MKKILSILLVLVMVFSFAACGDGEETAGGGGNGGAGGNSGNNYKAAVELFADAMYRGNKAVIESLAPKALWDYYQQNGMTKDSLIETAEYVVGAYNENYKAQFGDDYTVTLEITESAISAADVTRIGETLSQRYGINKSKVTAAYSLQVKVVFRGAEPGEDAMDIGVVKIDGAWYCVDLQIYDEGVSAGFCLEEMAFGG